MDADGLARLVINEHVVERINEHRQAVTHLEFDLPGGANNILGGNILNALRSTHSMSLFLLFTE